MSSEVGAIRGSTSAKTIRRARARRLVRRIAIWVGLPTLLAIAYYGFWATPQYESVAVFTVQSNKGSAGSLDGLSALLPGVSSSPRDAMLVREFALSRTMLSHLDAEHEFSEHYRDASADFWSRLDSDASREDVYDYYTERVSVNYSPDAGTLTLRVRAFSADKAQVLAKAIRVASENMVNEMSTRARVDRLAFIEEQVQASETRLSKARKALLDLQIEGHELSPEESAVAILGVRTQLEGELASAKAELSALQSIMTNAAPKVLAQRQKVRSLQGQVNAQNKRLVDEEGDSINASIAKFEPLLFEKEVAQRSFETALGSLEMARMEVLREQRYLVTISEASLPEQATEPRRLWSIATIFALSIALMGIFGMLGAALREHAKY
jgi:capsular polysaccharide transport system permease protein